MKVGVKLGLSGFVKAAVNFSMGWIKTVDFSTTDTASSGNYSQLASSGNYSQLASSGFNSQLASSGDDSSLEATGKDSIVAATGANCKVKGAIGCFIACAEWKEDENGNIRPVDFQAAKVDGEIIKSDTWYTVRNGKFVEVEGE